MNQADRHNRVALEVVMMIVSDTIAAGGDGYDAFFLLETVCVATLSRLGPPGSDEVMVARLASNIKRRLGDEKMLANRLTFCEMSGAA